MPLHLRKLCVGAESIDDLARWQEGRLKVNGGRIWHRTRNWPKREDEVLDGGSLYWIIKGVMSVRQRIVGFEQEPPEEEGDRPYCRILLDPALIRTHPWPHRPFQGWRYLVPSEAPPDIREGDDIGDLPPEMAAELKSLGLL